MTSFSTKNREEIKIASRYKFVEYNESLLDVWERMASNAVASTLLHTRKFLAYHGNKFDDKSLLLYDEEKVLRAIFPAARDPSDAEIVISHPGITYGGLLHDGWLRGQRCLDAFVQLCEYYAAHGFKEIIYKAVPLIYHQIPAQDDIYSLFRLDAERYRVDLSTTIDLDKRGNVAPRRIRSQKKGIKSKLELSHDFNHLQKYWDILAENLNDKYGKKPVHTVQELRILKEKFPQEIELITTITDNKVIAGTLLFYCPTVVHAQYLASNEEGRESGGLDLAIEEALLGAKQANKRFFDFGISTDEQGRYLNDGLHTFKCEFGASGSIYEFYRVKL